MDVEWHNLFAQGRQREYPRGTSILRKGEPAGAVLFVVSGWALVTDPHRNGSFTTLELKGRGQLLGETAAITQRLRNADVRAVSPTTVRAVSHEQFLALLADRSHLATGLFMDLQDQHHAANIRTGLRRLGLVHSLSRLLLDLAQRSGGNRVDGIPQKVIADVLGVTPRTLRTCLDFLAGRGALVTRWRVPSFEIADEAALRELTSPSV